MRVSLSVLLWAILGVHVCADDSATPAVERADEEVRNKKTLIATIFGKPLYVEQVTPASVDAKRKELPRAEFDQWLRAYRGRRTYENIWGMVRRKYVKREQLSVSEEDVAGITRFVQRRLESETEPPTGLSFTPEERKGVMIAMGRAVLMDWKVCKSLYEEYGGRVGIGSLGAWTAFDGQNALLREHHKAGDIKFHHDEMEQAFWQHTKIKNFADAYPKGERLKRLLATPPYLRN